MDPIWNTAIKSTGAVGVVSFLIYMLVDKIYNEKIYALLGGERIFVITLIIFSIFSVILVTAILAGRKKELPVQKDSSKIENKVTYKDNSTHDGDNRF